MSQWLGLELGIWCSDLSRDHRLIGHWIATALENLRQTKSIDMEVQITGKVQSAIRPIMFDKQLRFYWGQEFMAVSPSFPE